MSILLALQGPAEVNISGAILEGSDAVAGTVELAVSISGAVTEGSDVAAGTVAVVVSVSGAVLEGADVVAGDIDVLVLLSGEIQEGSDSSDGTLEVEAAAIAAPSAVSGGYWPQYGKRRTEDDIRRERIKLGILPPELEQVAEQAVSEAITASQEIVATKGKDVGAYLLAAMEARETYENAYRQAYKQAYVAEVVAEHWKEDMRRARNRRAALLLLH